MLCGLDIPALLIASHIKPWDISNDFERLDFYNGLLLCDCHDSIFDKGYISFDDSGNIQISNILNEHSCSLLNINPNMIIEIDINHTPYLKWHRDNCFTNNK